MAPARTQLLKILTFNKESSRIIHEMGNIELYELGQISRTVQYQSCLKHILEGLTFCACGTRLRPDEEIHTKDQSQIPGCDCPLLLCTSELLKRKKTQRNSVAKRPLESNGCPKRSKKDQDSIVIGWQEDEKYRNSQKAHGWTRILPILEPPHDDRHLLHRTLAPEALVREHHHVGMP